MAKNNPKRTGKAGGSLQAEPNADIVTAEDSGDSGQRDDSGSGSDTAGEEAFPVELLFPNEPINVWEHFGAAIEKFQYAIIISKNDDIKHLTVCSATAPSPTVPAIHITPFCGFPVTKANDFTVLLSNGQTILATTK